MEYQDIELSIREGAAYITLNRPNALNSATILMLDEIGKALDAVHSDRQVRTIVISGAGRSFCSGADLKFVLHACEHDYKQYVDFLTRFHKICMKLMEHPLPVIAAVHGHCLAGGLELMLSCDIAISADDAIIGDQHTNFGFAGAPNLWLIAQRIGMQRALELILTGRWMSGKEAESSGLVLRSVPRERLSSEVDALVAQLQDKGRDTAALVKRMVRQTWALPAPEALDTIYANIIDYMALSPDAQEGLKAFNGKRKPKFA